MKRNIQHILLAFTLLLIPTSKLFTQCGPVISTFPYNEGFEAGTAWTSGGAGNDWAWGTPAHPIINSAGGGIKAWCVGGLTGQLYSNSAQSWLMSPCFNFSGLNYPWISFKIFWENEPHWDGMTLQYSLNGGTTWTMLGSNADPVNCLNANWFNRNDVQYLPSGSQHGWSGSMGPVVTSGCWDGNGSGTWITAKHCMTSLAGQSSVRFRFLFGTGTTCNVFDGIAIDDILIQNAPPNNANYSFTCISATTVNFTNLSAQCPTGYSWNFGDPASGASNTSTAANPSHTFAGGPGTYNISLTSSGPCNAPSTVILPVTILGATTSVTNVNCNGAANGSATANINGSAGPFTYSWSTTPVQTTSTATGLAPGTYTVTVSAAGSCSVTATATVAQPSPLAVNITAIANPICGGNNGSLTAAATGGNGGYTYLWTPAAGSGQVASILAAGTYTCTVTDAMGCTATTSATLVNTPLPVANAANTGPYCAGATIHLSSIGGGTYSWAGPLGFNSSTQNPFILSSTVAMGGLYTVTVTDANLCTATATTNVVVNAPPTPAANNTGPYCIGENIMLLSSGANTYQWNGPLGYSSTAPNPVFGPATLAMAGVYTVTATGANGCTNINTTTVIVNPSPVVNASNTGPYCLNGAVQLNASGGTNYSWNGPMGYSSSMQNPSFGPATVGMNGTYTVNVTDINGCSNTNTTTVAINVAPVINASNTGPYCEGATLQLNSSGGTGYSWSGPLGYTSSTQNPAIINSTTGMSGIYTVLVTDANGCTNTNTTNVTVNPLPSPIASNTGPYCENGTIQLNASGGTGYSWVGPLGYTNAAQNPTITPALSGMSGNYTVTITDANTCSSSTTTNVIVSATPVFNAGANSPLCNGSQLNLTAENIPGGSYNWAGPNGFSAIGQQNPSIPGITIPASGVYTVTATDGNGCTGTSSVSVLVNSNPVPIVNNNGPLCEGATLNLGSNGGINFNWTGPNGFIQNIQNPSVAGVTTVYNGNYTVTVTDGNNCTATALTNVVINPLPLAAAANSGPVCEGTNVNLLANGGTSYTWTGPAGFNDLSQNPVLNNVTISQNGNYTVVVTDINNCSATASTNLQVNPFPVINANVNTPVCIGNVISLSASGAINYSWTGPAGFASILQNPTINNASLAENGIYTVTGTDAIGCSNSTTVDVIISANPTALFNGSPLIGCAPLCVNLIDQSSVTGSTLTSWNWNVQGQNPSTNQNETFCFDNPGTYDASLTVTTVDGCIHTLSMTDYITVYANPMADFSYSPTPIFSSEPTVNFIDASLGNIVNYSWILGDGATSSLPDPVYTYADTGIFCVTLEVTDANGCMDIHTQCLQVIPEFSIYIPNSFTPNQDEINPVFKVYGRGINTLHVAIYDRWGKEIFSFTDITKSWSGTFQDGEDCPAGIYVYQVIVTNSTGYEYSFRGQVTLLR